MNVNHRISAILSCVVFFSAGLASAQDWPQWRGANRDGKVSGFTAPQEWPSSLSSKWKVDVGTGDASPALVGDKLYVFTRQDDNEVITCLDAASGDKVWTDQYPALAITGAAARHPGPRSSPAVAEGKVVTLGVGGTVSCLDAATGKPAWRNDQYKAVPKFFTSMSPMILDGLAIVQLGGINDGAIVAFDLASGAEKWKWTGEGSAYASPAVMSVDGVKQLVTMTDKSIVSIGTADGKLLWQIPFEAKGMGYNAATPIIDGQTVIYAGQGRGTKAVKIEKQGDAFKATELWSNPQLGVQFNTPVLKDGLLFGLSDKGGFFCIDAKTGQTAWTDSTKRGGNFAAIVDAGPVLVALPSTAELIVIKPDAKQYTELAKIKVSDTPIYAHPILARDRLFVKDQQSLTMFKL